MDIGSLFLSLGVKGSEKTLGALTGVKQSMGELGSTSLETKAAILAAMYALERLFATSGKAGTDLTNFNAVTGESIKTLQQYQYAARQVGVSNEEVEGTFKTLQASMTNVASGTGAAPTGMATVSETLRKAGIIKNGISQKDVEDFAVNPEKLILLLQKYAQVEKNIPFRTQKLKTFGLNDSMIAALSRNAFKPEVMKNAPTYSDKEVNQLDKANIAWSNLSNKIQMAVGHFNALHGGQLVKEITVVVTQLIKFVELITKIAEKLKVFDALAAVFGVINKGLEAVSGYGDKVAGDKKGGFHGAIVNAPSLLKGAGDALSPFMQGLMDKASEVPGGVLGLVNEFRNKPAAQVQQLGRPQVGAHSSTSLNNQVDVNISAQGAVIDHKKIAAEMKPAMEKAAHKVINQHINQHFRNSAGNTQAN